MSEFAKDGRGIIHLIGNVNAEFTLCGNAWEGDDSDEGSWEEFGWKPCPPQKITCEPCLRQIKACKTLANRFIL